MCSRLQAYSPLMCLFVAFAVVTNPVLEHVQKICQNTVSIELSYTRIKEVCTGLLEVLQVNFPFYDPPVSVISRYMIILCKS